MIVGCHGCNTQYPFEEDHHPAGTRPVCPDCGTENRLPPQEAERETVPEPRSEAAAPVPESRPASHVSCPACGHRFVPAVRAGTGRRSVLLVEDQKYFAALTRDALGADVEVTVAVNVSEAREALGTRSFDVTILDLSLESAEDGRDLLETLHRTGVPVLIFTARDETELYGSEWEALKRAGATDILLKGMNVADDLRRKVLSLLGTGPDTA